MGSSPVTATISSPSAMNLLVSTLEDFFREAAPLAPGDGIVVAFSGGPDSTALLAALAQIRRSAGRRLTAGHLDHGLDPGSAGRAEEAARLAAEIGVPLVAERREVPRLRQAGESAEAAARRVRYEFLEEVRRRTGSRYVATAHHRDDQAETVILRLLFGSGLEGIGGVWPVQRPFGGTVVRPFLTLSRADLLTGLAAAGLRGVEDPTNADAGVPRNRVRHRLLPALCREEPDLPARLARLAGRARGAAAAVDRRLARCLHLRRMDGGIGIEREALERLPPELHPFALAWLHRQAGAPYPAGSAARGELLRQMRSGRGGCDCGGEWRWEEEAGVLFLRSVLREGAPEASPEITYTLRIPGELEIPELRLRVAVSRRPVEPWMFEGSPWRAALALPLAEGDRVTVRNRRPGDRIHPLGANGSRKLKEVLIDHRVPRRERERLPLICVGELGERIAWVPGVTIDHRFRIDGHATAWVAEVTSTT